MSDVQLPEPAVKEIVTRLQPIIDYCNGVLVGMGKHETHRVVFSLAVERLPSATGGTGEEAPDGADGE